MPLEREAEEVLDELHDIVQNSRYTATGKVQAITEVLYGTDGEYFADFESHDGEGQPDEDD